MLGGMDTYWGLLIAALLVFANGFFVATEFAIVKVRGTRLDTLAKEGERRAPGARRLVDHLDEYLSATQLGITLASLGLGWIGEPAFSHLLRPVLDFFGLSGGAVVAVSSVLAFVIITFLHIVVGELAPKTLAIQRAEQVTLVVATPMRFFLALFYPAIWVLNGIARWGLRLVGLGGVGGSELGHSEEELRLILTTMRSTGGVPAERLELLERALRLPGRTAWELMVARGDIVYLRTTQTPEERKQTIFETRHTRYPVVDEDLEEVLGILHVKDLLLRGSEPQTAAELRKLLRAPLYVPETMRADVMLREFRRKRQHMAIVVDEYGGTAGLVTVEDVVATVLGEVQDEFADWGPDISPLPSGAFSVDPTTSVEDFAEHFQVEVEAPEVSTVGGLIMVHLDRIPVPGDRISTAGVELTVEEMRGPKILRISARRLGPRPSAPSPD